MLTTQNPHTTHIYKHTYANPTLWATSRPSRFNFSFNCIYIANYLISDHDEHYIISFTVGWRGERVRYTEIRRGSSVHILYLLCYQKRTHYQSRSLTKIHLISLRLIGPSRLSAQNSQVDNGLCLRCQNRRCVYACLVGWFWFTPICVVSNYRLF